MVAAAWSAVLAALMLVLVAMLYVVSVMLSQLVYQLVTAGRQPMDRAATLSMASGHWSLPLLHEAGDDRVGVLLDLVRDRLKRLITTQIHDIAVQSGGRTRDVEVVDTLVCQVKGITTDSARRAVESAAGVHLPFGPGAELVLLMADGRQRDQEEKRTEHVPFFRLYCLAVVAVMFIVPLMVIGDERSSCGGSTCGSALTSYGKALHWLAFQFFWQDVPGLVPSGSTAVTFGLIIHFLLPMTAIVGITAARNQIRAHKAALDVVEARMRPVLTATRVLIMTVTPPERRAVLAAAEEITKKPAIRNFSGVFTTYDVGMIAGTEVCVVQAGEQGPNAPGGAIVATGSAIRHLEPDYAVIAGICCGLRPETQKAGDILVSQRVHDIDHVRLTGDGTDIVEWDRGENLQPNSTLLSRCHATEESWVGAAVDYGEILSWNKLVNSEQVVTKLRKRYQRAVACEMEGAGFHASARHAGVPWILVKAISDFGVDKTDEHQAEAACNAARFVIHMVEIGALRTPPGDLLG
ncbi:5'-methylthioadenosine/S-adenosylhomocysteine nucleosidase [Actinophytocola oryzae]|uniref:5'-methylthioadenosine/S-adenosylhomocysteine nucleosidase family protein n=1 Tax=Actinophytocola oryzae TaxID=502181 RepID=UPI0014152FAE|nr:5'-methylthioadenosine/S-adenosylhomocysteine nucleosidase [Actinophytocola oryzae]